MDDGLGFRGDGGKEGEDLKGRFLRRLQKKKRAKSCQRETEFWRKGKQQQNEVGRWKTDGYKYYREMYYTQVWTETNIQVDEG